MDIESIIPCLSYEQKIRTSCIDPSYATRFLDETPPHSFYNKMYEEENIAGLEFIKINFFKSFRTFLDTKYLVRRVVKDNKLTIMEWLLSKNDQEINGTFKNLWNRKHIECCWSAGALALLLKYEIKINKLLI